MFGKLKKERFKYALVFQLLRKAERKQFIWLVILDTIASIIDIVTLAGFVYLMRFIVLPDLNGAPKLIKLAFEHLVITGILLTLLFYLKNIGAYFVGTLEQRFVYKVAARISEDKLDSYFELPYSQYTSKNSSSFVYEISQLPVEFCHYILRSLHQLFSQIILILITVSTILVYKPSVFFLLLVILLPIAFLITYNLKKRSVSLRTNAKKANEVTLKYLQESLQGYIESKIFNSKEFFKKRYIQEQAKLNAYLAGIQSIQVLPSRIMEAFAIGAFFILLIIVRSDSSHLISITTIAAFMAASYKLIPALSKIINALNHIHAYRFTIDRLFQPDLEKNIISSKPSLNSIEFKNIGFNREEEYLINDFNVSIARGDFIGINGDSGKGKTTFINLLLGFYDNNEGEILFNGIKTSSADRLGYVDHISYVKQQAFLIDDSLTKNITLKEDTTKNEIEDIIKITGLSQMINGSGDADHKKIFQDGKNISGGQIQRIAFARALSKKFDLLILDEPFSELDPVSENHMVNYLKNISDSGKMVLLISHNKQSLKHCNKIISFDE